MSHNFFGFSHQIRYIKNLAFEHFLCYKWLMYTDTGRDKFTIPLRDRSQTMWTVFCHFVEPPPTPVDNRGQIIWTPYPPMWTVDKWWTIYLSPFCCSTRYIKMYKQMRNRIFILFEYFHLPPMDISSPRKYFFIQSFNLVMVYTLKDKK